MKSHPTQPYRAILPRAREPSYSALESHHTPRYRAIIPGVIQPSLPGIIQPFAFMRYFRIAHPTLMIPSCLPQYVSVCFLSVCLPVLSLCPPPSVSLSVHVCLSLSLFLLLLCTLCLSFTAPVYLPLFLDLSLSCFVLFCVYLFACCTTYPSASVCLINV